MGASRTLLTSIAESQEGGKRPSRSLISWGLRPGAARQDPWGRVQAPRNAFCGFPRQAGLGTGLEWRPIDKPGTACCNHLAAGTCRDCISASVCRSSRPLFSLATRWQRPSSKVRNCCAALKAMTWRLAAHEYCGHRRQRVQHREKVLPLDPPCRHDALATCRRPVAGAGERASRHPQSDALPHAVALRSIHVKARQSGTVHRCRR